MTTVLLTLAVLLGGPLAGLSLDRSIVAMPAWRRVGVAAWATFSRQADLGNGLALYPLLGVGAPIASVAAAISYLVAPGTGGAALPIGLAAVLSVAHLIATARAAPVMAGLRGAGDEEPTLRTAFASFERWQRARAVLHVAAFLVATLALIAAR